MNIPKVFVRNHGVINLGRQGENDVLQVVWKGIVPAWTEKYGEGRFQLAVRRHLDDAPYIAAIEIDGDDIVWTVTNAETAQIGDGECELTYMVGDAVAKSQTWTTSVCRSLTGEEPTEAPEPYQSWVDEVMKAANDLKLQGMPEGGEKGQALFLAHLIQGENDSDGNPTYTVDKTFAEIKAAYDAGKKVELIPPTDGIDFIALVGSAPFIITRVAADAIIFQSIGASLIGVSDLPTYMLGGVPLGIIGVSISSDEKVWVQFPFFVDGDTEVPTWETVQKLPQQYIVNVVAGTDGVLTSHNTLSELQSVMEAYALNADITGTALINVVYNGKLYYMSANTPASMTFTATTENGLETLTVSNDGKEGSADVWTHEVVSLISDYTFCPYLFLHENNTGGYYLSDKDGNEVLPRVISNQYGSIQYIYYRRFKYTISSTGNEAPYVDFLAVNGDKYAIISVDIAANYGQGTVTWSGWEPICPNQTPKVTTADNGKFLRVVDGAWAAEAVANAKGVSF